MEEKPGAKEDAGDGGLRLTPQQDAVLNQVMGLLGEWFPGAAIITAHQDDGGQQQAVLVRYTCHQSMGKGLLYDAYALVFESEDDSSLS